MCCLELVSFKGEKGLTKALTGSSFSPGWSLALLYWVRYSISTVPLLTQWDTGILNARGYTMDRLGENTKYSWLLHPLETTDKQAIHWTTYTSWNKFKCSSPCLLTTTLPSLSAFVRASKKLSIIWRGEVLLWYNVSSSGPNTITQKFHCCKKHLFYLISSIKINCESFF